MEATAIILAPSPSNPPGEQTQTGRAGDNHSFAPALSHAVSKVKKNNGPDSDKSSVKTDSKQLEKPPTKEIAPESVEPEKINTDLVDASSLSDKTAGKPSGNTTTEVDSDSETIPTDTAEESTFLLTIGASGYLFTPSEALATSDLQKSVITLAGTLVPGKQDGLNISGNILQDVADPEKDTSAGPQLKDPFLTTSIQDVVGRNIQNTFKGQLNPDTVRGEKNTSLPGTGQDQSTAPWNITQGVTGTGQDTLLAQQLQKILTAYGMDSSIVVDQPARQNPAVDLNSLSSPLFTGAETPGQQTTTNSDISEEPLTGSLAKAILGNWFEGKNTGRSSSSLEDDLHGQLLLAKVDLQGQKDTAKVLEKDAALKDSSNQQQTNLLNSSSSTGTTDSSQQAGQFSFGSSLVQSLATGQHTTGTTGSHYQLPWTSLQENNLINQVIQNFHINSGSSTSKLVLKLYPEELGELKIDIQMKDGGIKANIVTQTEQVQQVLEKYIPKLRSFLEQQGLTVDDILVTLAADDVGRHDLFQKDFADNHDFSPPGKSSKSASFVDLSFDKAFSEKGDTVSGVNVTV